MSQIGIAFTNTGPGGFIQTLTGNTGGPVGPTLGNINTIGAGNITIAGNPGTSTLTATLVGTTNHAVQVGNAGGALTSIPVGTTGQVLTGVTGADPVFAAPAASSISITGDSGGALVGNNFTFTGGTTGLLFNGGGTTETLGGTLVVTNGGTGRATLTNHGLLVGAGTAAITQLGVATNGQLPIGSAGLDPVLATLTPGTGISITNGAGSITITATGTTTLTYTNVNTTPYVVLATDEYLSVDCSGGPITIQFPNAATTGREYIVKDRTGNAQTNNITLRSVSGAVNIDGVVNYVMNTQYAAVNIIGNSTSFEIF